VLLYFLPAVNKWKVDWMSRIKSVRNSLSLPTIVKVSFTVVKSNGWIVTISWYPRKGLIWNIQFSPKCSCSLSRLQHWNTLKLLSFDFLTALYDSMKNIRLKERCKTTRLRFYLIFIDILKEKHRLHLRKGY